MSGNNSLWNHLFTSCVQLLILILLFGKGSALTVKSSGTPKKTTVFNRLPLNDALFTGDVLLEVSAGSQIDCSKKCVETEGCVMCTFLSSPQGPPGHCRLHSQLQNLTDAWQNKTGAESFERVLCGEGYMVSCGRCLRAGNDCLNYTDAQQQCHMNQGQLVMPKTLADLSCVDLYRKSTGWIRVWVGANDKQEAGVFRWNDGTSLPDNSTLWKSLAPRKNNPGADCVIMGSAKLADIDCPGNSIRPYICEKAFM